MHKGSSNKPYIFSLLIICIKMKGRSSTQTYSVADKEPLVGSIIFFGVNNSLSGSQRYGNRAVH